MRFLVLLACVALANAGGYYGLGGVGSGLGGGYGYGLKGYGGYGLGGYGLGGGYGYGLKGYGGYGLGGYGLGGYGLGGGYGYGYPSYGVAVNKGYAGAAAASAQSSASSSSRRRSKTRGEFEQTIITRVKRIVECEIECHKSRSCRRQWAVAHSYWGSCQKCSSC